MTPELATPEEIRAARAEYQSDDITIDLGAHVSRAEHGVWVQAWVWVPTYE